MIAQMLSREPSKRPSFDHILSKYRETIFPEYFYTFLQDYINSLNEKAEDSSFRDDVEGDSCNIQQDKVVPRLTGY